VPVRFKFAVVLNVVPKLTSVEPIVTESFTKDELGTFATLNSILLFVIAVEIPEPPTISKLPPKSISKLVDVSSPIVIFLLTSLSFEIEPSNWAFVIVPDNELVG